MKRSTRIILIFISIVVLSLLVFLPMQKRSHKPAGPIKYANDTFKVRPLTDVTYDRTAERLNKGKYMVQGILQCLACHSPREWKAPGAPIIAGQEGSGGTVLLEDSAQYIVAPNITPDKETGAGTWTDDMLGRAIREGVGHDGRALFWQMPSSTFRSLSDEDLASVVVYLRSIPAIHHVVPPTKMQKEMRLAIEKSLNPISEPIPEPDLSSLMLRGKYLVRLGECMGCHTAHDVYNPGVFGGGNHIDRFGRKDFSANITTDSSGIGYGPGGFTFVIRTGKGGLLSPIMPWISYKNMNDEDLKAIYTYLNTFPHSRHAINNQKPFTHCEVCGGDHGLGDKNKLHIPAGIKMDTASYALYAGSYVNEENIHDTVNILREGNKLVFFGWRGAPKIELVPQSELHFLAPGWFFPWKFAKDNAGHITRLLPDADLGEIGMSYKKI